MCVGVSIFINVVFLKKKMYVHLWVEFLVHAFVEVGYNRSCL